MALDLAGLSNYIDQNRMELIKKFILGGRSTQFLTIQPDIKSTAAINILSQDLVLAAGGCGFTDNSDTILTQQNLTVCPLKLNNSICLDDLQAKWTQTLMNPGSYNTEIPFEQLYVEDTVLQLSSTIDQLIWKGDTVSGSGQLDLCDGYIYLAENTYSASTVAGNTGGLTALTVNNIIDAIDGMAAVVPVDIINRDDLYIYMGYDTYRLMARALRNFNYFAYTGAEDQGENFSQMWPGTNLRVIAVKGLNGTNKMFLSSKANMYYGTDLMSDYENLDIFFSQDHQEVRTIAKFKTGVAVAFPEYLVYFTL
tara:strand:+ start:780 stop:1709 length:930 start_codon:yes stop_codon:yes gene_type:complete